MSQIPLVASQKLNRWQSGLFNVFADCEICCTPNILLYQHTETMLTGQSFCNPLCCLFGCTECCCCTYPCAVAIAAIILVGPQRAALREKYGIEEEVNDYLEAFLCFPCVTCQHARELKARGLFTHEQVIGQVAPTPVPQFMYDERPKVAQM